MAEVIAEVCAAVGAPDGRATRLSKVRQLTLARPADSLGELDGLVHRIAGMRGWSQPTPLSAAVSVLAGDHGVAAHGTSAFRDGVSAAVLRLITAGRAPVNILAGRASAVVH